MNIEKLRFYHLMKQNLLEKKQSQQFFDLIKEQIALHSTDYLTPYLSLWNRVSDFKAEDLFTDLNQSGQTMRLRAFRGTLFVIHKEFFPELQSARSLILASRFNEAAKIAAKIDLDLPYYEQVMINLLTDGRVLTAREIKKELKNPLAGEAWTVVIRYLELKGTLSRGGQRYITDKQVQYRLALPLRSGPLSPDDQLHAVKKLVLSYIRQFGPVSLEDICWWFPLSKAIARKVLILLKEQVTLIDFNHKDYYMEKEDWHAFQNFSIPSPCLPHIMFLPYEDHFAKAYTLRDWYLHNQDLSHVFQMGKIAFGELRPTIWLNGRIIGRWEMDCTDQTRTEQAVRIDYLNHEVQSNNKILPLVEKAKASLNQFINQQLVPLMQKK